MDAYLQRIPRPVDVRRLDVTPWAGAFSTPVTMSDIERAFVHREDRSSNCANVSAAVLIGVVDQLGGPQMIFIRRALHLAREPGLIAFPGGRLEEGERAVEAALREAEEEIGLEPRFVDVLCSLGVYERSRDGIAVIAYVGIVDSDCTLRPSEDEVDAVFRVPVSQLLSEGSSWQERWSDRQSTRVVSFFTAPEVLGNNLIWGLTAAYVGRFLEKLLRVV